MKLRILLFISSVVVTIHSMNIHNKGLSHSEITAFYVNQKINSCAQSSEFVDSEESSSQYGLYDSIEDDFTFSVRNNKKEVRKAPSIEYLCSVILWQESEIEQLKKKIDELYKQNKKQNRRIDLFDNLFEEVVNQVGENRSDINEFKSKFLLLATLEESTEDDTLFQIKSNKKSLKRSKKLLAKSSIDQLSSMNYVASNKNKKKRKK